MQRIEIIGNLAADATMVTAKNGGEPFMSFKVICNEKKGEVETAQTFEITGKATGALQFLRKGKKVFVAGMPSVRTFTTKDGKTVGQLVIRMSVLDLL